MNKFSSNFEKDTPLITKDEHSKSQTTGLTAWSPETVIDTISTMKLRQQK